MERSKNLTTKLGKLITLYLGVILAAWLITLLFTGCTDTCTNTTSYTYYEPVYKTTEEVRSQVGVIAPRELVETGKIYIYESYLLINQPNEGIHIVDNTNPADPQSVSFINIPGNFDMAVRNNKLYADSYIDLLTFDITDPANAVLETRLENVFPNYNTRFGYGPADGTIVTEMKEVGVNEVSYSCTDRAPDMIFMEADVLAFRGSVSSAMNVSAGPSIGTGGSMARFAIVGETLYAVDDYNLNVFGLTDPSTPEMKETQNIGWGIETIFPYENNLFIGSRNGMFIYGIDNPEAPQYQSEVNHITTCDPVVANDDYAFVTLRAENSTGWCGDAFVNQLDVIDITTITNARLLKSYEMISPHGLGLDQETLFITEGEAGLKVYDITDVWDIDDNLVTHLTDYPAFDVIPNNGILIMIGTDGIYQFDYADRANLELLSIIPVTNAL